MAVVFEKNTGKALVRIHYSGTKTKEEWEEGFRKSAVEFFNTIRPELEQLGKLDEVSRPA